MSGGAKVGSQRNRSVAPETSAAHTAAAERIAVKCWAARPGFGRPDLMLSMRNGRPVMAESDMAVRSIWPPPSPREPSISSSPFAETGHKPPCSAAPEGGLGLACEALAMTLIAGRIMKRHEPLDVGEARQRAGLVRREMLTLGRARAILLQERSLDE